MNEYVTVLQAGLSGLGLTISSFLYSFGGRGIKGIRRYGASFVLFLTVNMVAIWRDVWVWPMLFVWPILYGAYSLGYGADKLELKLAKRLLVVLMVLLSGFLLAFCIGGRAWWILIPHAGIGLWSVYMGVRNPIEAAGEEFMISMMVNLCLIAYPFSG